MMTSGDHIATALWLFCFLTTTLRTLLDHLVTFIVTIGGAMKKVWNVQKFICKDKVLQPDVEDAHELGDHKHKEVEAGHVETPLQPDGGDEEEDGKLKLGM